jgi:hypothetical protein
MADYKVPTLDSFVWQAPVKSASTDVPTTPLKGHRYLIPSNATGVWATHILDIATYTGTIWEYKVKAEGIVLWVEDIDKLYIYTGAVWTEIPKSADNNFYFGDGLLNDKSIIARTNQTYCPAIRYNADLLIWQISNGGDSEDWNGLGQSGLFDIDMNGDLEPNSSGAIDDVYELDSNSDIQPKA